MYAVHFVTLPENRHVCISTGRFLKTVYLPWMRNLHSFILYILGGTVPGVHCVPRRHYTKPLSTATHPSQQLPTVSLLFGARIVEIELTEVLVCSINNVGVAELYFKNLGAGVTVCRVWSFGEHMKLPCRQ
jgi:hypothetical protein